MDAVTWPISQNSALDQHAAISTLNAPANSPPKHRAAARGHDVNESHQQFSRTHRHPHGVITRRGEKVTRCEESIVISSVASGPKQQRRRPRNAQPTAHRRLCVAAQNLTCCRSPHGAGKNIDAGAGVMDVLTFAPPSHDPTIAGRIALACSVRNHHGPLTEPREARVARMDGGTPSARSRS